MEYKIVINKYVIGITKAGDKFGFDLEDFDLVKKYSWSKSGNYFMAYDKQLKKNIYLHRLIMDVYKQKSNYQNDIVHHITHNTSDNRKINLELVSTQENLRYPKKQSRNISGCTGVTWNSTLKKWQAIIGFNYKNIMLGMFNSVEDAIKARKQAELDLWNKK